MCIVGISNSGGGYFFYTPYSNVEGAVNVQF